jgi:tetratricopeptide (TPR) repeat protein
MATKQKSEVNRRAVGGADSVAFRPGLALSASIVLFVFTLTVYFSSIHNEFINFDDDIYVYENARVTAGLNWAGIQWAFKTLVGGFWCPLSWLSLQFDSELFGLRPWGYHLTSVLLHAANGVLLFLLFRRMTGLTWRSAFVAGLFVVHPLHVESVAWVAERKDVLSTFFWLASLLSYVCYVQQSALEEARPKIGTAARSFWSASSRCYVLALFFFLLSLLSKAMAVTAPMILLLLDWWPLRRFQRDKRGSNFRRALPLLREKLPFLAVAFGVGVVTLVAQAGAGALENAARFPFTARLANALLSYVRYAVQMVWPFNLAVFYPFPKTISFWAVVGAVCLVALLSVATFRRRACSPYLLFGWGWYVVTLLPVIGFIQVGAQAHADRYTYVPLIGLFALSVWGLHDLTRRWRHQALVLSIWAIGVGCFLVTLTRQQLDFWADSEMLFTHAIKATENNDLAITSLGNALLKNGLTSEAVQHFQTALQINPDYALAHNNLGNALLKTGQFDEAIAHFRAALELYPGSVLVQNNLGNALTQAGLLDEAILRLRRALEIAPDYSDVHYNLGIALFQKGQTAEAIAQLRAAAALDPGGADVHYNLGIALLQNGQAEEAMIEFRKALELRPDFLQAHCNLGNCLLQRGALDEAITHFREAVRLEPAEADTHYNLGVALLQKGQPQEAIAQLRQALAAKPSQDPVVLETLAGAYVKAGQPEEAVVAAQNAYELAKTLGQRETAERIQRSLQLLKARQHLPQNQ